MNKNIEKQQVLDVYLQNHLVGQLYANKGVLSFSYCPAYIKKPHASQLSVSLPLQDAIFDHGTTYAFFSGLLPDEAVRQKLAKYLGLSEKNIFALLKIIGGECAGAVSLYSPGFHPKLKENRYRILTNQEAHHILSVLDKHPLLADEPDIRLSGAGAQNKLMIAFMGDQLSIPLGNSPSTHIIKPSIQGVEHSIHNEYFCMRLAKNLGLPVPEVTIYWLENIPYYLIERYDRVGNTDSIIRLHQEDFCQALHIPPEIKYENEGGPTMADLFSLLDLRITSGLMQGKYKIVLLQGIIYNFLIGNGDAHAKNFSLLYKNGVESLAPFYDLLSTVIYASPFKARMAMKIGGKYKFSEIFLRHWERLSDITGFKVSFIKKHVFLLSESIMRKAELLAFELNVDVKTQSAIYEKIIEVIDRNVKQIQA